MSLSKCTLNFLLGNGVTRASGVFCARRLGSAQPEIKKKPNFNERWNKVVADAEKIVGYRNSFIGVKWLLSEEVENIAVQIKKMKNSKHPLVETVKEQIYNANNSKQPWGLVILLISKALGHNAKIPMAAAEKNIGYLYSQRALAEITEMIRTSHIVHKGLLNIPKDTAVEQLDHIVNGNKIALLCGDHLLSTSCLELAKLENQELIELMSSAVRDLSESGFIGLRDYQNLPLPSAPRKDATTNFEMPEDPLDPVKPGDALGAAKSEWTLRNILEGGNLLGKACQGSLILAGHSITTQRQAYQFGLNLALAWQASTELKPFVPEYINKAFSLVSAPVLFTLEHEPALYEEIKKGQQNVNDVNHEKIREIVMAGPGLEKTKNLLEELCNNTFEFLEKLPDSEARESLESLITRISGK